MVILTIIEILIEELFKKFLNFPSRYEINQKNACRNIFRFLEAGTTL